MGKCILHFDQIEIIKKKSDSGHSDNDWLILYWFVGGGIKQSHTLPLKNTSGSTNINSGNSLQPFALEVSCKDTDLVTAAFQIVNLGSSSPSKQVQEVGQIASKIAQALTDAYVEAAEFVVANSGLPLGSVFAEGIDAVQPAIVATVKTAFEDVIIPVVDEIAGFIAGLLGSPNCNGDVLHDIAVFPPSQPAADLAVSKVYTAASKSGCGGPAKTSVHLTLQRVMDFVPMFPSEPPPKVETVPSKGESPDYWLGTWAEDSYTPTPIITVTISRSTAASGTYAITVNEHVDRRFNAKFEAADNVEWPESVVVPLFQGNLFGTVRPWLALPVTPSDLQAFVLDVSGADRSAHTQVVAGEGEVSRRINFTLPWTRPRSPLFEAAGIVARAPADYPLMLGYEVVDAFVLEGKGVTLCLLSFQHGGVVVGRGLRYIRDESMLYTRADVKLVSWTPLK